MEKIATILHVDDNPSVLRALERYFHRKGYHFISVSSGQASLEWVRNVIFDVAILDLNMPGMNGFRLLKALRECYPKIPIIILTGREDDYALYQSILLDCDGFVTKTTEPHILEQELKSVLLKSKKTAYLQERRR